VAKGKFLTVEGVEGAGKSSSMSVICELLERNQIVTVTTREPGGTVCGERIRDILLDKRLAGLSPVTELSLLFAARAQHVHEVIKPALQAGSWVVCDRFTDSTYAYQGGGRQLSMDLISAVEALTLDGFGPDHTLLLDLDVEEGLKRAARVGEKDRFESESVAFFERVRSTFLERAGVSERTTVVSAESSLLDVQAKIAVWLADMGVGGDE
jgi:dTMP kinase